MRFDTSEILSPLHWEWAGGRGGSPGLMTRDAVTYHVTYPMMCVTHFMLVIRIFSVKKGMMNQNVNLVYGIVCWEINRRIKLSLFKTSFIVFFCELDEIGDRDFPNENENFRERKSYSQWELNLQPPGCQSNSLPKQTLILSQRLLRSI